MITLGIRDLVVNDPSFYPLVFTGGAGNAATATNLNVKGFHSALPVGNVVKVVGQRGRAATVQTENVTAATAAEITVAGTIVPNTIAVISIVLESKYNRAQFARHGMTHRNPIKLQIVLQPGDTAATVLAKVYNAFVHYQLIGGGNPELPFTIQADPATVFSNGIATSCPEIQLLGKDETFSWTSSVTTVEGLPHPNITVWKPTVTIPSDEGLGTPQWIDRSVRIRTNASVRPYAFKDDQFAQPGALYTTIYFEMTSDITEKKLGYVADMKMEDLTRYEIYVRETPAGLTYVEDILTYFDRTVTFGANEQAPSFLRLANGTVVATPALFIA